MLLQDRKLLAEVGPDLGLKYPRENPYKSTVIHYLGNRKYTQTIIICILALTSYVIQLKKLQNRSHVLEQLLGFTDALMHDTSKNVCTTKMQSKVQSIDGNAKDQA